MTRQRTFAAALFTAVILAVLSVIAYSSYQTGAYRQQVYVVRHDVVAGSVIGDGDLAPRVVRADPGQFQTAESRNLGSLINHRRYLLTLHRDDILRLDDTSDAAGLAQVPVSIAVGSAGLIAGDTVDIYADANGTTLLLGRRLQVLATGNPTILGVNPASSPFWVSLSFSTTRLAAVRSVRGDPAAQGPAEITVAQALCALSGSPGCAAQPSASR